MIELGGANLIFDLLIKKMYTSLNFVDIHSDYMVHFLCLQYIFTKHTMKSSQLFQ